MNTKRNIISEVEQMAINAIVHQPDDKAAAEKHFSETAKKIVETALQAVDIMEVGDVCRRAVTGAAIHDFDLLAKLITDKDFDHDRLAKAIEALASEKPIDYPTFYTPGWLCKIAKWLEANGGAGRAGNVSGAPRAPEATEAELHEAATEEPTDKVKVEGEGEQRKSTSTVHLNSSPSPVFPTLPPGADGTPPAEEETQSEDKAAKTKEWIRKHYSFCDGIFPIRFTNTEDGQMASCWINGRHFTLDLDNNERDDGGHDCAAIIRDNGKVVVTIETQRGKAISGRVAYGAYKEYVRNLSGGGKYASRGCFLKQALKRHRAAAKAQAGEVA